MISTVGRDRRVIRRTFGVGLAASATAVALAVVAGANADSTPIGPLPPGPTSTIATSPKQLVAVAMPRAASRSGLVWRLARPFDSRVVRQVAEADVGQNVVVVFRVVGRGDTSLVFALTRGDASTKAVKAVRHRIRSR